MTDETPLAEPRAGLSGAMRATAGLFAHVVIAAMLLAAAGLVAVMTAFAGLMLGTAALVMRFAARRSPAPIPVSANHGPVTLNARRTPRGWTVE